LSPNPWVTINCVDSILIIINVLSTKRKEKEKRLKLSITLHDNYALYIFMLHVDMSHIGYLLCQPKGKKD
jgi:hypothetical protein